jgi:hypothetical protein
MSLIEAAGVEGAEGEQPVQAGQESGWAWKEGVLGEGEKPEYLLPKYKTVEAQAKAYTEAEKRLGAFTGAPKEGYDLSFLESAPVDSESPQLKKFLETATELNISQDAVQTLLGIYAEYEGARIPNMEEELKKLGSEGKQQLGILNQWAKNNLSEEEYNLFTNRITTAEDVKLFMTLRGLTKSATVPTKPGSGSVGPTEAQLKQQIIDNPDKYNNNVDGFRDKLLQQLAEVA